MLHTLKNIKIIFLAVFLSKVVCIADKSSKPVVLYRRKNAVNKFIKATLGEYDYCKNVIEKHFNKNLVMSVEDEERFQSRNKCWICKDNNIIK